MLQVRGRSIAWPDYQHADAAAGGCTEAGALFGPYELVRLWLTPEHFIRLEDVRTPITQTRLCRLEPSRNDIGSG